MLIPSSISLGAIASVLSTLSPDSIRMIAKEEKEEIKPPSTKYPPNGANPKAVEKYWEEFVEKYSHVWNKYSSDMPRQWACCVAIWINYCVKRKIQPFTGDPSLPNEDTKENFIERIRSTKLSLIKALDMLVSTNRRKKLFAKRMKETFLSVDEPSASDYIITSRAFLKLEKSVEFDSKDYKAYMSKKNYSRRNHGYERSVRPYAHVRVAFDDREDKIAAYLIVKLNSTFVETLVGVSKKEKERQKGALIRFWKKTIQELSTNERGS